MPECLKSLPVKILQGHHHQATDYGMVLTKRHLAKLRGCFAENP